MLRWVCIAAAVLVCLSATSNAQDAISFAQLPKEARDLANEVRNQCKELEPDMKLDYDMSGIHILDLTATVRTTFSSIMKNFVEVCGSRAAIAAIVAAT